MGGLRSTWECLRWLSGGGRQSWECLKGRVLEEAGWALKGAEKASEGAGWPQRDLEGPQGEVGGPRGGGGAGGAEKRKTNELRKPPYFTIMWWYHKPMMRPRALRDRIIAMIGMTDGRTDRTS